MKARCLMVAVAAWLSYAPHARSYEYLANKVANTKPPTDFELIGPDKKPFHLSSLHGKVTLLAFGFTHCPNICPTTLADLAAAYELLTPAEQKNVTVLFISVDPERDKPAMLKDYVSFFNPHFLSATGTPDQIAAITTYYGVEYERNRDWGNSSSNYTLDHTPGAYLLARSGRWIAAYGLPQLLQRERLAEDLRHFIDQDPQGEKAWQPLPQDRVMTPRLSGGELYAKSCAECHGKEGGGVGKKYPALAGSEWVTGPPNRLTALVLGGIRGGSGDGSRRHGVMPAWWRTLTPAELSKVLTYIRKEWGNDAPPISAAYVQKLGYKYSYRTDFWTWKELKALPPEKAAEDSPD